MDWFRKTFLASFENCNGKRITEKQFNIFEKYLMKHIYKESDTNNSFINEYHFEDKIIILQESVVGYGKASWKEYYLTVR